MTGRGQSVIWRFDVRDVNLDSANRTIELHASGDDSWSPEPARFHSTPAGSTS